MPMRLITPPAAEPLTVYEARAHLRLDETDTSEDAALGEAIQAAREAAEHETGRALLEQTWETTADYFPVGGIELGRPPVQSITSITYRDSAGAQQTLAPSAYTLDDTVQPAEAVPVVAWPTGTDVRVRFVAGYGDTAAAVPAGIKRWMKLRIGTLYAQREDVSDKQLTPVPHTDRLLDPYRTWS